MISKLQIHLTKNYPFLKDKKLLIAVSGGIDSITLVHLLHQLQYNIAIAHCNFQLRGKESDADELFVKDFAAKLDIPFYVICFETKKLADEKGISIQMVARELRYDWFEELLEKYKYDYLLTAHHLDDMLETFLINLTRGTGLDGLVGIPDLNDRIVRPLLIFQREEISNYVKEMKLEWREDESNLALKYHRNKIRHQVIPVLKEMNPSLLNSFQNTLKHLKNSQELLHHHINDIKDDLIITELHDTNENVILRILIEKLNRLPYPRHYLFEILKNYGFTEWDAVCNLANTQSGKLVLSKTHRLIKDREYLLLTTNPTIQHEILEKSLFEIAEKTKFITNPIKLSFQEYPTTRLKLKSDTENTILIDKDLLKFPLILRKWEKGDYFCPFGMEGTKRLSKFFKDEKFSLPQKENTWLLCSENKIVWIVGKRLDNRFRVTSKTNHILKIILNDEENS